jgi:hypothetical protein
MSSQAADRNDVVGKQILNSKYGLIKQTDIELRLIFLVAKNEVRKKIKK